MIAHVAAAGEGRGRVVVLLAASGHTSDTAIQAALSIAQAFQSEIETLFVENGQLIDLARFPFAREISFTGRATRTLSVPDIEAGLKHLAADLHRKIARLAGQSGIACLGRTARGEAISALADACAEAGPWNVVTLAEPVGEATPAELARLFSEVHDTTAVAIAGPAARRVDGTIVAIVDDIERAPPMLRAAERLAAPEGRDVRLILAGADEEYAAWMEGQARLALGEEAGSLIVPLAALDARTIVRAVRRLTPGFVITRFGGSLVDGEGAVARAALELECPMLVVR